MTLEATHPWLTSVPETGVQSLLGGSFPPTGRRALVTPTSSPLLGPMSHIYGPSRPSLSPLWNSSLLSPQSWGFQSSPPLGSLLTLHLESYTRCPTPTPIPPVEATGGPCPACGC